MREHLTYRAYLGLGILAFIAFFLGILAYRAISYDFTTLDGKTHRYDQYENKIMVVNYFAEWCAPCLREIPELNEFYHQLPNDTVLFAVSYDNLSAEKLLEIKNKYNIEFPLVAKLETPFPFERPAYLPATFLIKKNGEVAGQLLGEQTVKGLNEAISQLQ
jgi:thiol-disulfide isomerase/thioredoxin